MHRIGRYRNAAAVVRLCAAAGMMLAYLCTRANAQPWQKTYGDSRNQNGTALAQTYDGGFAVAGVDYSYNGDDLYVYILRTDDQGNRIWDRQFSLGAENHGAAVDVKQCANGDLIFVGYVGPAVYNCWGCWHTFVLRLDASGNVVWQRIYGTTYNDQFPVSIVETQLGNGWTTNAGDFVIGGYVESPNDEYKGLLMRVNANGEIIWQKLYDAMPGVFGGNAIVGVDEALIGSGAGDIVAGGTAYIPGASEEVWVLRVDGNTGLINVPPQGSATFGLSANDWGMSIQELRAGPSPGDLVLAAGTSNTPWKGAPGQTALIEVPPDPCDPASPVASRFYGDIFTTEEEHGYALREIRNPSNGTLGNLALVGIMEKTTMNLNLQAFLQEINVGTLTNAGACHTFGGANNHEGAYLVVESNPPASAGFALVGNASSSGYAPAGNGYDIFLVKTAAGMSSCIDDWTSIGNIPANMATQCNTPDIADAPLEVLCCLNLIPVDMQNEACSNDTPPQKPQPGRDTEEPVNGAAISDLHIYPNPAKRDDDLTIGFDPMIAGSATITVSDMTGRTVYTAPFEHQSGVVRRQILTTGWPAGAYTVTVKAGDRTLTGRVVVAGR